MSDVTETAAGPDERFLSDEVYVPLTVQEKAFLTLLRKSADSIRLYKVAMAFSDDQNSVFDRAVAVLDEGIEELADREWIPNPPAASVGSRSANNVEAGVVEASTPYGQVKVQNTQEALVSNEAQAEVDSAEVDSTEDADEGDLDSTPVVAPEDEVASTPVASEDGSDLPVEADPVAADDGYDPEE